MFAPMNRSSACRRGGVIAMRPLLIHASSKIWNLESRRVLHAEYADSLDIDDGVPLAVVSMTVRVIQRRAIRD